MIGKPLRRLPVVELTMGTSGVVTPAASPRRAALRIAFGAVGLTYLVWNGIWLFNGQLAPSMFWALTGVPSPTTGGTRSLAALWRGDLVESLQWNACLIPICGLLVLSLIQLAGQAVRRAPLRLAPLLAWGWLVILAVAWALKLLIPEPTM
jgi:hypothetical protein